MPGSDFVIDVDLVILAIGFSGPTGGEVYREMGVARDARGTVVVDADYRTSVPGVFAAGDVDRGASLIVWAIREGQDAARSIDQFLR